MMKQLLPEMVLGRFRQRLKMRTTSNLTSPNA